MCAFTLLLSLCCCFSSSLFSSKGRVLTELTGVQQRILKWILELILQQTAFSLKVWSRWRKKVCLHLQSSKLHYVCVVEGTSQLGFLELSQSQDLQANQDNVLQPNSERQRNSGLVLFLLANDPVVMSSMFTSLQTVFTAL